MHCKEEMKLGFPMVVDGLDDAVNRAYAAWPERLYLVDLDGKLAYCGRPGPRGFEPKELDKALARGAAAWARGEPAGDLSEDESLRDAERMQRRELFRERRAQMLEAARKVEPAPKEPPAEPPKSPEKRRRNRKDTRKDTSVPSVPSGPTVPSEPSASFAPLSDVEAWDRVPRETPPLPLWARKTMESLPITTLLQLRLDALHRTENPLGKKLSARLRWIVADTNRCLYSKQAAEADLKGAGVDFDTLQQLADLERVDEPERSALAFARRLTLSAASITDDEVAALVAAFGPDDVVAIVLTVAFANFQDRVHLALGLTNEPDGAVPPIRMHVAPDAVVEVPDRVAPSDGAERREVAADVGATWSRHSFDELQELLEKQKARTPRLPEPDATRLAHFPRPDRAQISRTVWGRMARGYQPVLALAWSDAMRSFGREAKLDPVLSNTVFWVVTRTNDCFY